MSTHVAIRKLAALLLVGFLVGSQNTAANSREVSPDGRPYFLPTEDAPVETDFDEHDEEVLFLAKRHGVSIARAVEIANWMEDVSPFLTALPTLSHVFADARVIHGDSARQSGLAPGDLRIEISVTNRADPEFIDLQDEIGAVEAGARRVEVVVKEVPRTLVELDELAAKAVSETPDPGSMEVIYDFENGEVVLRRTTQPEESVDWLNSCTDVTGGSLDGGRKVRLDDNGVSGCQEEGACTSGFPMRFGATYGITTAGHCLDAIGVNYPVDADGFVLNHTSRDSDLFQINQPTSVHASTNAYWRDGPADGPNDDDIGYLRRADASVSYPARVWKWSTGEWRNITGYESTWQTVGMTVCVASSQASLLGAGNYCGEVTDSITNYAGQDVGVLRWTAVDFAKGDFNQGHTGGPGSSGGTVYYGGQVFGTNSNATDCPDDFGNYICRYGRYYRADEAYWVMLSKSSECRIHLL